MIDCTTAALRRVETPLMERYVTTCENCGHDRQFFGTAPEARQSALTMGWEFRRLLPAGSYPGQIWMREDLPESAYCPHCKLLVKS